ncbi:MULTISPECIES: amino acid ABC transporter substrate-binding protein [unclassified Fibrobacter]|uniref:amino acid ABC transporter substrate-binding protein n=1 Tax=unclassified Fibrobacter TaxID=2634177 RepID=UPI0009126486|nr:MULTISPECIES: amino acid ABC transporter substrate-binding protein [unclassified Fibrobacter]OWV08311.1 amino acid ABC transporter substrate-binding protein [Fibrobacter sp. UWH3]OWV13095.1 amino acid ABC transporter substrate-binding protein [Fibrobacter sp. UWH1]SHL22651.1 amino acid ABC transporter substrate-binding protein, PAAT family [Fibrobacter sp. UWH6]
MKFFTKIAMVACCAAFLFGCNEQKNDNAAQADESLNKVKAAGTFVLGLDDSFPPMGFRDKDNNIVGFDIDLAAEVCARLGVTLKTQPISWDAKEQELNTGKIDCIWNGMSVDSARAAAMNLSDAYLKNRMIFSVKDKALANLAALAGKKIAVQNGSTAQKLLEASDAGKAAKEIVPFDDNQTAMMDLDKGGVDAVFLDEIVAKYWIASNAKDFVVLEEGLSDEVYAIGFRKKDQALRDAVNETIKAMQADGKFAEIQTKWFGK